MTPGSTATSAATKARADARAERPRRVVVVGNPNVGKTSIWNRLARENARVGNYAGVTVERRVGRLMPAEGDATEVELSDVPGAYSLSARSAEEQIAIGSVLGIFGDPAPDLVLVVVDAGQLVRNLYLVVQLLELGVPSVLALNMIDEAAENPPRPEAISRLFGVPCVATNGRTGEGLGELTEVLRKTLKAPRPGRVEVKYPEALRADVDRVADALPSVLRSSVERDRALARWALVSIDDDDELVGIDPGLRERVGDVRRAAGARDLDQEIIASRYAFLDEHAPALFARGTETAPVRTRTERLDRFFIHPVWGFLVFVLVMTVLFQALFSWAEPGIHAIEWAVRELSALAERALPESTFRDFVVQGLLGGVGNVIVFLPQIALLFVLVGLLEDSGYMARVAYLMDRVMRALGLHGRAFVPMLSGFACAIPAILATRTMERRRDRILTMLVVPLMTCSARLPVYTLVIAALIPPRTVLGIVPVQAVILVAMYFFATMMALVAAAVLGRTVVRGTKVPLILELPPYRMPSAEATLRMTWERCRAFLRDAGTTILACTVVLWVLLSHPKPDHVPPGATPQETAAIAIRESWGGRLGRAIEPAIRPLGFDWKIGVGLVGAFAAREVFVSTMGIVEGVGGADDAALPLRERIQRETRPDGTPAYSALTGLSLLVFFAIACQCMSTLVLVRKESGTWKWPAVLFAYTAVLAWTLSFAVYQGGRLLGF
ncbi:MAG TPA: ferrous iron transport protein B [Polyangiaceae bacterium]|nr:ferrous iron transport protein B [Polyangiaceae bacterium]